MAIKNLEYYELSEDAYSIRDLMDGVLARVVSVYESYSVPLPVKQYWTMGTPAMDCEQLVVAFVQAYLGAPGDEANTPQRCNMPKSAVLSITVTREIPIVGQSGKPPLASKIQEYSEISAVDAWVLMDSVKMLDMWDEGGYGPGVIATISSLEPQGGLQTINLQITMVVP